MEAEEGAAAKDPLVRNGALRGALFIPPLFPKALTSQPWRYDGSQVLIFACDAAPEAYVESVNVPKGLLLTKVHPGPNLRASEWRLKWNGK